MSGATTDVLSVTGTLTVGPGGVTVNVTNLSPPRQTYTIVSAGTLTNAAGFSLGTIINPGNFTYALNTSGNTEQLVVTAGTGLTAAYFVGSGSACSTRPTIGPWPPPTPRPPRPWRPVPAPMSTWASTPSAIRPISI